MATSLPDFPPFDTESEQTSLGIKWKKWILRLENLFVALDINDKARQKALLCTMAVQIYRISIIL